MASLPTARPFGRAATDSDELVQRLGKARRILERCLDAVACEQRIRESAQALRRLDEAMRESGRAGPGLDASAQPGR